MKGESKYINRNSGDGSWSDLLGDVYSGIAVGMGHSKNFVGMNVNQGMDAIASMIGIDRPARAAHRSSAAGDVDDGRTARGLRVVGVGYGRTGTYSLALALDELGFPTLHTQHLYENQKLFNHLSNTIFKKSIQEDEIIMGHPDFDLVLKAGYSATMDLPFALYFDQIKQQYPNCKFILTVRENSEVWFRSWEVLADSIIQPAMYTGGFVSFMKKLENYMRWLFSIVNNDKKFLNHPFPLPRQNKRNAIASYEQHNQSVRDSIPPSRLLEYDVRQGWDPLCQFLEIPGADCPSAEGIPFPKSNSARAVQWQSYSAFIFFFIAIVFVLFALVFLVFRKVTGKSICGWLAMQRARLLRRASESLALRREKAKGVPTVKKD